MANLNAFDRLCALLAEDRVLQIVFHVYQAGGNHRPVCESAILSYANIFDPDLPQWNQSHPADARFATYIQGQLVADDGFRMIHQSPELAGQISYRQHDHQAGRHNKHQSVQKPLQDCHNSRPSPCHFFRLTPKTSENPQAQASLTASMPGDEPVSDEMLVMLLTLSPQGFMREK